MMYLGDKAVGLNQLLAKNIPLKWDIVEYNAPSTVSSPYTIYHNLGAVPDIFMLIPDMYDTTTWGAANPSLLFGTNDRQNENGRNRMINNYLKSDGTWDYTANPVNISYAKDSEKVDIYTNNGIKANAKYYAVFIKFNTGGDT